MTQVMVSSPEPEATEEGLRILGSGGNVIHAAIGAALVQTAVDPFMRGIAGFGSMRTHLPVRRPSPWMSLLKGARPKLI